MRPLPKGLPRRRRSVLCTELKPGCQCSSLTHVETHILGSNSGRNRVVKTIPTSKDPTYFDLTCRTQPTLRRTGVICHRLCQTASTEGLTSSESSLAHLPHRPFLCEIPLVFLISTASSCNTPSPSWSGPLVIPLVGDLLVGQRQPFHFGSQVRLRPSSKAHVCVCVVKDLQSDLRFVECPIIFMFQENPGRIVRLMTLIDPFLAMGAAEGHTLLS